VCGLNLIALSYDDDVLFYVASITQMISDSGYRYRLYSTRLCHYAIMSNYVGHARQFILYRVGFTYICPIYIHVYTVIQFFVDASLTTICHWRISVRFLSS